MRLLVLSDPHFASPAEQARRGWERRVILQPALRLLATAYRRLFWLADPTAHNHQLDAFIAAAGAPDWVVANGDYSCDSAFVGLSDAAAAASARECLGRLARAFGDRLLTTLGDHELGKMSLFGGVGGPRLASWETCVKDLGLRPLWKQDLGAHVLVGVTSSILALPTFEPELLATERDAWRDLRKRYLASLRELWKGIRPDQRVILFCHDPSALPFLAAADALSADRLAQIRLTVIGHLHSELILRTSTWLAGMPEVGWLGNTARRLSGALRRAKAWAPLGVTLCPSLSGIQLLRDGGYLELELDARDARPPTVRRHRLPWRHPPA